MSDAERQEKVQTLRNEAIRELQAGRLESGIAAMEAALDLDPSDVQSVLLARQVESQVGTEYRNRREAAAIERLRAAWDSPRRSNELLKAASFQDAPKLMECISELAMTKPSQTAASQDSTVSIIIPTYNREGDLQPSLESVAAQQYPHIELLLVDDGSSDSTVDELNRFREEHPGMNIRVLPLEENHGQATARNRGAAEASGEFLLFHDSDDLLAPNAVSTLMESLAIHPDAGWASPLTVQRGDVNRLFGFERPDLAITVSRNQFTICALLLRSMFTALGGFNEEMSHGLEDWEFWIRAMSNGYRAVQVPEVGLIYNRLLDSTTGRLQADVERRLRAKLDIIENNPELYRKPEEHELGAFGSLDHFTAEFIRLEGVAKMKSKDNPLRPSEELNAEPTGIPKRAATETLRVLFVCHDYPPLRIAGAQLYAHYLAKSLISQGHEVHVFHARNLSSVDNGAATGDLLRDEYEGVPVFQLIVDDRSNNYARNPQYAFENADAESHFEQLLNEGGYDLVHIHLLYRMSTRLPMIARRHGIPTVATLHDYWLPCAMGHMVDSQGRECSGPESAEKCASCIMGFRQQPPVDLVQFFEQRQQATKGAFASIDRIFSPSGFLADVHAQHGFGKPEVLPLGWLPLKGVQPHETGEKLIFGFCGQIVFRKGVDVMLKSFAELPAGNWELHIHGKIQDERYFEQLKPFIEGHPSISYHGPYHSDELPAIYSTLDVSVMPSRRENYPLTLLESLSAGVPPIAADVGGVREILGESAKSGFVFPNGDSEALTSILQKLVADPSVVRRMRNDLPKPKSIDENAIEMEAVYRELITAGADNSPAHHERTSNSNLIPRTASTTSVQVQS